MRRKLRIFITGRPVYNRRIQSHFKMAEIGFRLILSSVIINRIEDRVDQKIFPAFVPISDIAFVQIVEPFLFGKRHFYVNRQPRKRFTAYFKVRSEIQTGTVEFAFGVFRTVAPLHLIGEHTPCCKFQISRAFCACSRIFRFALRRNQNVDIDKSVVSAETVVHFVRLA